MRTLSDKLLLPYRKVDLGCGLNQHEKELEEWIYVDGDSALGIDIVCDWNFIPIESESVDEIHTSDTIEHVKTWEYDITFPEWNRIMKIGGKIWGTTPARNYIIKAAYEGLENEVWIQRNLYGDGNGFAHTHYTTFTQEKLTALLEKYGWGEVRYEPIEWWIHFTATKIKNL